MFSRVQAEAGKPAETREEEEGGRFVSVAPSTTQTIVSLLNFSINKQEQGQGGKGWLVSQSNCSERRKHLPSCQSRPHFPFSQRPNFPSCFVDIATVHSERVVIILICISWWACPVFFPNRDPGLKRGAFGIWPPKRRNPRPSAGVDEK